MTTTTTILKGPADASHFRVKVGRYGDRWYTDPLPTCPIAEASEWQGPSVSATKPPFANKYVPMKAIAEISDDEWKRLAGLSSDDRYEAIKAHEKATGRLNMDRGSLIHLWAEDLLRGGPISDWTTAKYGPAVIEQAQRFRPALEAFFDAHQPELVAAEVVCLHRALNGVGYGGTADAFVRIEGDLWAVDWKSRNSDHDAYLEEAAQGGAYIGAEYVIVEGDDGTPQRVKVPDVAGVLIVSIREDGARAYPIDGAGAVKAYHEMHRWWCAQQEVRENGVIGKPWAPKAATKTTPDPTRRGELLARYQALNDADRAKFVALGLDKDNLDAIENALDDIDQFATVDIEPQPYSLPWGLSAPPPAPEEGATVDDADVKALERRYGELDADAKAWTGALVAQGNDGHSWRIREKATVRRYELYRGVLALASWAVFEDNDQSEGDMDNITRSIVHYIVGEVGPLFPTTPPGLALGTLNAEEACKFAEVADGLAHDRYSLIVGDDGALTVGTPVA